MNTKYNLAIIQAGPLGTNCYLVSDPATLETLIIDPGGEADRIIKVIKAKKLVPVAIVNTHGHADHTGANTTIKNTFGINIYTHEAEEELLNDPAMNGSSMLPGSMASATEADVLLKDGEEIKAGSLVFKVMHTPGHTPGGMCLQLEDAIFTGDTLFRGDIGRSDLPGGDEELLMKSLQLFRKYPRNTVIYPGHGPSSTLEKEFSDNPYLT
jgi:glyoxylase-like metal-dependent hydrolase (beta-lactamase superfamily II)